MRSLISLMFFLILPLSALAGVEVTSDKPAYNLGDVIVASYSITSDEDLSGLTYLSLICSNFELTFYITPIAYTAGQQLSATVPALAINSRMNGRCFLDAEVISFDRESLDSASSPVFDISDDFPVTLTLDKDSYKPAETIVVSGTFTKSKFTDATVVISFLDETEAFFVSGNSFSKNIKLPSNTRAGKHSVQVLVNDSPGNKGSASGIVNVRSVPTQLLLELSQASVKPGDIIEARATLSDQTGNPMEESVEFLLYNSTNAVVMHGSDTTPVDFKFEITNLLPPAKYTAQITAAGLSDTASLVIDPVESIAISLDGNDLLITNTGNVEYSKSLSINLDGAKADVTHTAPLSLNPGSFDSIDLSKEVPEDDYYITFPQLAASASFESHLDDQRSTFKKMGDSLGITGNVVKNSSIPNPNVLLSSLAVIIVLALGLFFFFQYKKPKDGDSTGYIPTTSFDNQPSTEEPELEQLAPQIQPYLDSDPVQKSQPEELSRDDDSVKAFMENIQKDKPM